MAQFPPPLKRSHQYLRHFPPMAQRKITMSYFTHRPHFLVPKWTMAAQCSPSMGPPHTTDRNQFRPFIGWRLSEAAIWTDPSAAGNKAFKNSIKNSVDWKPMTNPDLKTDQFGFWIVKSAELAWYFVTVDSWFAGEESAIPLIRVGLRPKTREPPKIKPRQPDPKAWNPNSEK